MMELGDMMKDCLFQAWCLSLACSVQGNNGEKKISPLLIDSFDASALNVVS